MSENSDRDDTERERLSRYANVERDRLLRIVDTLIGRRPVERAEHRAKQVGIPILIVAVAGTTVGLVLSYRQHRKKPRAQQRRMPAHLEVARNVIVSVATFVLGALAKRTIERRVFKRRP